MSLVLKALGNRVMVKTGIYFGLCGTPIDYDTIEGVVVRLDSGQIIHTSFTNLRRMAI